MALCLAFVINFLMLFYKVKSTRFSWRKSNFLSTLKAMALETSDAESGAEDAIEPVDDDDNEVIMMDPKNFYMVYLLEISAFLHSSVAFLMMISYYKLKVRKEKTKRTKSIDFISPGAVGHFQTRKRNRS